MASLATAALKVELANRAAELYRFRAADKSKRSGPAALHRHQSH
jgi:hypothetical protein